MRVKRHQVISLILVFQVLISIVILVFDLGGTAIGSSVTSVVAPVIPAVIEIADISPTSRSGALVLAFSWMLVLPSMFIFFKVIDLGRINYTEEYAKTPWYNFLGVLVFGPVLVFGMMNYVPNSASGGRYGRMLYRGLQNYDWFIILYAAWSFMTTALVMLGVIFMIVTLIKKRR